MIQWYIWYHYTYDTIIHVIQWCIWHIWCNDTYNYICNTITHIINMAQFLYILLGRSKKIVLQTCVLHQLLSPFFWQFNPADEEEGYLNCCVYSTDTCKEFYTVRPVNNGQFYTPPIISMSQLWRTYIHYID